MQSLFIAPDNAEKNVTFRRRRATEESGLSSAVDTERNRSDRYIVGGLNISKSKIGRSVSDAVCMRPERSGRETTLVVFVPRCMCAHISSSARRIRCWNAGPLVGATQCPRSPFPLLAAVSVADAARIPELRAEIRFVRVPQRQPPHRSHYLYGDP